ncbi:hypothetical protein BM527_16440 [Alteromonas sp. Mex14]|nr:hypothetical protein BM527_16440 [Alteromonas sp. Mex14]
MFYKTEKKSLFPTKLALIVLLSSAPHVFASQDEQVLAPYELKQRLLQHQRKAELESKLGDSLLVMPTSQHLDVAAFESYDEFVITVTGAQGYSKQIKNTYGSIDIYDLDLPYDGKYSYEVLAIKYTGEEISDVMNNGRGENASTRMSLTHKVAGYFSTHNGEIEVPEVFSEKKVDLLPEPGNKTSDSNSLKWGEK